VALTFTPRTWTDGEVVTMGMLNANVRDPFAELMASWNTYAPTWTATTTNPDIGNGVLDGRYKQVGKTVWFRLSILFGSTTDKGVGTWFLSLPSTPLYANTGETLGTCAIRDVSVPSQDAFFTYYASSSGNKIAMNQSGGTLLASTTIAWATGDRITLKGEYEIP